jgi:hypothetical protein
MSLRMDVWSGQLYSTSSSFLVGSITTTANSNGNEIQVSGIRKDAGSFERWGFFRILDGVGSAYGHGDGFGHTG